MNALSAQVRLQQSGPYEPIGEALPNPYATAEFVVIQASAAQASANASELPKAPKVHDVSGIVFPLWIKGGLTGGGLLLGASIILSVALLLIDSEVLYWATFGTLAAGVSAIAISMTGAKDYVSRVGTGKTSKK